MVMQRRNVTFDSDVQLIDDWRLTKFRDESVIRDERHQAFEERRMSERKLSKLGESRIPFR